MLRDFINTPDLALLKEVLARFNILIPNDKYGVTLIEFQMLTPDSFIWRLLIGSGVYYLYAEDFIENLVDIQEKVNAYAVKDAKLDFVKVKQPEEFNDTTPVRGAIVYKEPENSKEMMTFATSSGCDFVFLCKSDEQSDNVFYNGYTTLI